MRLLPTPRPGAWARNATAAGRAVGRAMRRPATYPGYLKEAALVGLSAMMYPVGVMSDALKMEDAVRLGDRYTPQLPLRYLDPHAASTPIILLHGYFHNRSGFLVMRRALKRFGFRFVDTMNYNAIGHDVQELAAQLAARVDHVLERTGATQVHLVGHSLGGIVARYYVQKLGGDEKVHTCITLGSPHKGTHAAYIGRGRAARQLRPGSSFLRSLTRSSRELDTRFVCYYSNLDGLVLPPSNAKLTEPKLRAHNILVKDLGHLSLLISRPLIRSVAETLATLDRPHAAQVRAIRKHARQAVKQASAG